MEGAFPVTMVPGDGVGPELMHAVKEVFKASCLGHRRQGRWGAGCGVRGWFGKNLAGPDPVVLGVCLGRLPASPWSFRSIT